MVNKRELETVLLQYLQSICIKKTNINNLQVIFFENYNMPKSKSNEILLGIKQISKLSDQELYWLTTALNKYIQNNNSNIKPIIIERYFSNHEISKYKNSSWSHEETCIYPIVFEKLIQVTADQWVGVLSTDQFLQLYNNQVINYNRNTQRNSIAKRTSSGIKYYINLKKKSVREIKELYEKQLYIPDDITLNLNLDNEELEYELSDDTITVYSGQLDIIDGYHRFRAMILEKQENPDFSYNMIVNIMNFSEDKANTYIAQKDKRNKIDKQFINSLDSTNPVHFVVTRLNEDAGSYLYGCIGKEQMLIDSVYLFALIDSSFLIRDRKEATLIIKYLKSIFNDLIENETIKLEEITSTELAIIIRGASLQKDILSAESIINKGIAHINLLDENRFNRKRVNKPLLKYLDDFLINL